MSQYGFPRSPAQIKEAGKMILDKTKFKTPFNENRPGKTWFYAFLRRHPDIKMSRVEKLEQARAMACAQEKIYAWFDEFEAFCKSHDIRLSDQVFNCDESGFPLQSTTSLKVCVDRHCRRNFQVTSSNKTSITTLQCICANGNVVPSSVLFTGVNFNPEYSVGFPANFYLVFTKSGWMETSQFYAWLTNHFVKNIPPIRPAVLLLDGHSSHIDYYVVQFCADNNILLFCLPPHSSHTVQPADRGFFGSFKSNFAKEVASFSVQYPGVSITKRAFPSIFTKAFEKTCHPDVVKGSFRVSGIWPICRENVDYSLFNPSRIYNDAPAIDMEISQISKSSSTALNRVIDTTEDRASKVNSLFTAPTDTDGVSNLNIQDSISDAKELPVTSSVVLNSEASCSEATEKLPSIIASSKMGNQTANETTLPGGSSLILRKSQNIQASTPNSSTSASHPVHCALL